MMKIDCRAIIVAGLCCSAVQAEEEKVRMKYHCEYCGVEHSSVSSLTASSCSRHPDGPPNKGRHKLYEGREKAKYTCKYCGKESTSISSLTSSFCSRHPNGPNKGRHAPAL